jgi:hypothetical protein
MKTKLLLVLAAALVLGTAVPAFAAKRPARAARKPAAPVGFQRELRKLGITCPRASVHLRGSFGSAGDGFVAVTVSRATGRAATLAGKQVALRLLASTRILRNGPTTAAGLKAGDRLNVVALMCSQGLVARTITATAKRA